VVECGGLEMLAANLNGYQRTSTNPQNKGVPVHGGTYRDVSRKQVR